jgi:hypothetical protein
VCRSIGKTSEEFFFWKIYSGSEIDLFWRHGGRRWGIEFKYADAPQKTRSMSVAMKDLGRYRLTADITVLPLKEVPADWQYPVRV